MTLAERISSVRRLLYRELTQWLSRYDARPVTQLSALRVIANGEVRSQTELAERLLIDAPAASRLVDRLEGDGLLRRCQGLDRRSVGLEVTRKAAAHIEQLEAGLRWLDEEVRRHLTDDEVMVASKLICKLQTGFSERK